MRFGLGCCSTVLALLLATTGSDAAEPAPPAPPPPAPAPPPPVPAPPAAEPGAAPGPEQPAEPAAPTPAPTPGEPGGTEPPAEGGEPGAAPAAPAAAPPPEQPPVTAAPVVAGSGTTGSAQGQGASATGAAGDAPAAGDDAPTGVGTPPARRCLPWELPAWPPHHRGVAPVHIVSGTLDHYVPFLTYGIDSACMRVEGLAALDVRLEGVTPLPVDRYGTEYDPGLVFGPRLRIGGRFDTGFELDPVAVRIEYEHDLPTGYLTADPEVEGDGLPNAHGLDQRLRKGFARISFGTPAQLSLGYQSSHWGLGLLANDGAHGWAPGSARFADPRGGDTILRALLGTGPHTDANLYVAVGGDVLNEDFWSDDDVLLPGDHAVQLVGLVMLGVGQDHSAGAYLVHRYQESADGRGTRIWAIDVTGRTSVDLSSARLSVAAEGAIITGSSQLAPSYTHPEQDVLQAGAALRANLDAGVVGLALDLLYASGDQNLDDDQQNAFKTDPNYDMGLLLYRQVLAAHTGRGVFTAGDPSIVGVPASGTERIATRGGASNTVAVFPRLRVRPIDGLEAYGGPLAAFAVVPMVDPFNTRVAGGMTRNALNGTPSRYLGVELDLGLRYRAIIHGSELSAGVEFGTLWPGDAFARADGSGLGAIVGGRGMVGLRL